MPRQRARKDSTRRRPALEYGQRGPPLKGTLIEFEAEGDYADLIADLRRSLKENGIRAVVRRKPGRRALIEGPTANDTATFMYLACFGFRVVQSDFGTDEQQET